MGRAASTGDDYADAAVGGFAGEVGGAIRGTVSRRYVNLEGDTELIERLAGLAHDFQI